MPAERVSMRQIREVLRLRFASELPQRAIAKSLGLSQGAGSGYLSRTRAAGVSSRAARNARATRPVSAGCNTAFSAPTRNFFRSVCVGPNKSTIGRQEGCPLSRSHSEEGRPPSKEVPPRPFIKSRFATARPEPSSVTITAPGRRTGTAPLPSPSARWRKTTPPGCAISARGMRSLSTSRRSLPPTST